MLNLLNYNNSTIRMSFVGYLGYVRGNSKVTERNNFTFLTRNLSILQRSSRFIGFIMTFHSCVCLLTSKSKVLNDFLTVQVLFHHDLTSIYIPDNLILTFRPLFKYGDLLNKSRPYGSGELFLYSSEKCLLRPVDL